MLPLLSTPPASRPRIAVVDDFTRPALDVNSDGEKDLPHGRAVEIIIRSILPAEVVEFTDTSEPKILTDFIPRQLERVLAEGPFDGVNISAGLTQPLRVLASKAHLPDLSPDNVEQHREDLRQYFLDTNADRVGQVIEAVEKVTATGTPVYFAAGNKGPSYINVFGLAHGAINVGATNCEGVAVITSARNSMLRYDRGVYGVEALRLDGGPDDLGGYNISGTKGREVTATEVSRGSSRVAALAGRALSELLARSEEHDRKAAHDRDPFGHAVPDGDPLRERLFRVEDLAQRGAIPPAELELLRANHYDFVTFDDRYHFTVDDRNRLVYDPDASHRNGLVGAIRGTSFAAPTALAHDLQRPC